MKKVLALVLLVFAIGCAKKYAYKPEIPVKTEEEKKVEGVAKPVESTPKEVEVVEEKIAPKVEEFPLAAVKEAPVEAKEIKRDLEFKDVLFDFDKYDIRPDAKESLDFAVERLKKNKGIKVIIEGHCDEKGTNEYNLALGEKRANTVKNYIIANGIAPATIETISYGEEKPQCTEQNEECWQLNRRAHFVVIK